MHLLASYRNGSLRALPQMLPAGLYEAAARRGIPRQATGSSSAAVPRQFSGSTYPRTSGSLAGPSQSPMSGARSAGGEEWAISPQDKAQFDQIFVSVDISGKGYVTGEEAVGFFSNSRLPEEMLAQIWDLADINSEGQLNRDEFAVAMFLIKQQRAKTDGRGVLPPSLPSNLVPPSMRDRATAPSQPTAPAFDNAANTTVSKSASEDLFGLDAAPSPAPTNSQQTPDRATFTSSPPPNAIASQPIQQTRPGPASQSLFKPFVPSSSFGQSILQPQTTGQSQSSTQPSQASHPASAPQHDDLLGDNDPEISKKLTQETSELANLSNQVSSLTSQMQQVKSKRISTEQDLSQTQNHKRDFENRLSQLRTAYENEVREVRVLEDRLSGSRAETAQLQRDFSALSETYQNLQNQHRQLMESTKADQSENADLRERVRQTNAEISALKTQLEKARLDAKKQQGLVAINKKQLSTTDGEKEKVQRDISTVYKEQQEAIALLQSSPGPVDKQPAQISSPPALPRSGSTTSMNPFFRQNTSDAVTPNPGSRSEGPGVTSPNMSTFDSLFGPSAASESQSSLPPPTSFQEELPAPEQSSQHYAPFPRVADLSQQGTISSSKPSTPTTNEPPPPPQSRQITSSYLPLRGTLDRTDSTSSSVRVVPPASRLGSSAFDLPLGQHNLPSDHPDSEFKSLPEPDETRQSVSIQEQSMAPMSQHTPPSSDEGETPMQEPKPILQSASTIPIESSSQDIPGAFPGDATPPFQTEPSHRTLSNAPSDTTFGVPAATHTDLPEQASIPKASKDDFNSAFHGFGPTSTSGNVGNISDATALPESQKKFPGIQEFGDDDDSDSDTGHGFDDDFTTASPQKQPPQAADQDPALSQAQPLGDTSRLDIPKRPSIPSYDSNASQLPTPGAQQSPPTYDQSMPPTTRQGDGRSMSNAFPAEYSGLLPSREDPTSPPPDSVHSGPVPIPALNGKGKAPGLATATSETDVTTNPSLHPAISSNTAQPPPAVPGKTPFDDFDNDFADLSEAKEATDEDAEPPGTVSSRDQNGFDEFNPTFDSPTPSRSTVQPGSSTFSTDNSSTFHDFESSIHQGFNSTSQQATNPSLQSRDGGQQRTTQDHDWDAIFAGLDTPQNNGVTSPTAAGESSAGAPIGPVVPKEADSAVSNGGLKAPVKPDLQRSLTGEDDPILKDLTNMGYPRDEALQALERYDYNLDVVGPVFCAIAILPAW